MTQLDFTNDVPVASAVAQFLHAIVAEYSEVGTSLKCNGP